MRLKESEVRLLIQAVDFMWDAGPAEPAPAGKPLMSIRDKLVTEANRLQNARRERAKRNPKPAPQA